jgi:DNA-binding MarR family transcriptional regulator
MDENKLVHRLIDIFKYKETYQQASTNLLPQDMYLLERLYFKGDGRVLEIAKKFNIAPSTLTGIINRLEKQGYIERIRGQEDRKQVLIKITKEGKEVVDNHINEDKTFCNNFFGGLENQDRENFKELLEKLVLSVSLEHLFDNKGEGK